MTSCRMGRRELMRWSAVVAGAGVLLADPERSYAAARAAGPDAVMPVNLELVTVTEDSAVLTWYTGVPASNNGLGQMLPAPADAEVAYGDHPGRLNRVAYGAPDTAYHYVELTGLEPGRTYYYQARSRGRLALPTMLATGNAAGTAAQGFSFTTPQPPPGRFLFSIALCNDLHLGETVAGLAGGIPEIIGISQVPGEPPYAEIMAQALVADARARGARYLLASGDVSAEAVPAELQDAKSHLDAFGTYRSDYWVARGNHDRAHSGAEYASCSVGQWQGNDCFRDEFFGADELTYFSFDLNGLHLVGLDTYDKAGAGADDGGLSTAQMSWLTADLAAHEDQPTLVFGHHPLVADGDLLSILGGDVLDPAQSAAIDSAYAAAPGVFLHHAGHTHRNKQAILPTSGVVHQEVGAVKEYPGGFNLLRLYTGGYALNFYKTRSEFARGWSERSRMEVVGAWPQISFGYSPADRNSVFTRDLSGLRRA